MSFVDATLHSVATAQITKLETKMKPELEHLENALEQHRDKPSATMAPAKDIRKHERIIKRTNDLKTP